MGVVIVLGAMLAAVLLWSVSPVWATIIGIAGLLIGGYIQLKG